MKKYKILIFILLGTAVSLTLQNFFSESVIANNLQDDISDTTTNQQAYPDFVDAAELAIKAVVHIKSKYTSNEV